MQSQSGYTWLGTDKQLLILRWVQVSGPCTQTFVMRIQIDVVVDTVCSGVPSFEEFACLFAASHGDHCSSPTIEAVVAINGVRKHEGQGIASADGQFVFVYAGPQSSTCMAQEQFAHGMRKFPANISDLSDESSPIDRLLVDYTKFYSTPVSVEQTVAFANAVREREAIRAHPRNHRGAAVAIPNANDDLDGRRNSRAFSTSTLPKRASTLGFGATKIGLTLKQMHAHLSWALTRFIPQMSYLYISANEMNENKLLQTSDKL
ncbi:unnamed protein product [Schistocephalus solidus]|uniref:Uncharacterized protein n=1 Tax=Schistocephalus solidus TaxID=70667 RepID=A0A183TNX8_SCHSO|nr:unnamed protein product [Schistocephalus solidus]